MERLKTIYSLLHSHFHPQHWWPVTAEGKLHPEYSGGPKNEKQQLEVCFGAILTQNTSWKNVEKAIVELNKHNLINIKKIIKNEKLAQIIKSSGYHNQKAKKLKNFCNFLLKNYDGSLKNLFNNNIEKLRNELLSINGIGPETADSILLYAFDQPYFVVDAYTRRIFSRLGLIKQDWSYNEVQEFFMKSLENVKGRKKTEMFKEYHALIVEHAKRHCRAKADCDDCFLAISCKKRF